MATNKKRQRRLGGSVGRSRRVRTRRPALQMISNERHTNWTCPVCRAVGTVDHVAGTSGDAIADLVRAQHAIKQPKCDVS